MRVKLKYCTCIFLNLTYSIKIVFADKVDVGVGLKLWFAYINVFLIDIF